MQYGLGVDIGGMSVKYSLVGSDGTLFKKEVYHFPKGSQDEQIADLGKTLKDYISSNLSSLDGELKGIGIGCPGVINSVTGDCDHSNNLHWDRAPLRSLVEKVTGYRTLTANDANAAALGESRFGAGQGYENIIMITIGTGIGTGIVINGQIYAGKEGKGAEMGHMIIVHEGRPCTCGLKGCFEAYCSATGLIITTKEEMERSPDSRMWEMAPTLDKVDGRTAFESAKLGDKAAQRVVDSYISHFGTGLINVCNIFRPDAILISGGVSNQRDALIVPLKKYLADHDYGYKDTPIPDIKIASLGDLTGIYGAAALVLD